MYSSFSSETPVKVSVSIIEAQTPSVELLGRCASFDSKQSEPEHSIPSAILTNLTSFFGLEFEEEKQKSLPELMNSRNNDSVGGLDSSKPYLQTNEDKAESATESDKKSEVDDVTNQNDVIKLDSENVGDLAGVDVVQETNETTFFNEIETVISNKEIVERKESTIAVLKSKDENNIIVATPAQYKFKKIRKKVDEENGKLSQTHSQHSKTSSSILEKRNTKKRSKRQLIFIDQFLSYIQPVEKPIPIKEGIDSLGFSFSPAGLLLPYHLGVASVLEDFGFLTPKTNISGASAGSLTAVCLGCNMSIKESMQLLYDVEYDLRLNGVAQRLDVNLKACLKKGLPPDAYKTLNNRFGRVTVVYTRIFPPKGVYVSEFKSNEDLIDCLCASCNIPFYFSTSVFYKCRGYRTVDGYFVNRETFGCPPTYAKKTIYVIPFLMRSLQLNFEEKSLISPHLQIHDEYLEKVSEGKISKQFFEYVKNKPAPGDDVNVYPLGSNKRKNFKELFTKIPDEVLAQEKINSTHRSRAPSSNNLSSDFSQRFTKYTSKTDKPVIEKPLKAKSKNIEALKKTISSRGNNDSPSLKLARMWNINQSELYLPQKKTQLPVLPFQIRQMLSMALTPTDVDNIKLLFNLGRADTFRWMYLNEHGYPVVKKK